jgi:1-aminocyclopropane-1-carboxylate deaminase/D-cysteine desulfhydrase-like pyridoxal-dependent ACC family enzyme
LAAADTTQAGLLVGAKALGETYQIVGINPLPAAILGEGVKETTADIARMAAAELGLDIVVRPDEVVNTSEYLGEGYAAPTPAGQAAIQQVASLEAILLDPVYTGKAVAALKDHICQGKLTSADTVVFLHTGGWPALFAYHNYFDFKDQVVSDAL